MTEPELLAMFQEFALVDEVNIIKDKATRVSRGCCFVICPSREEADKAVNACHNKKTLPGASSPLQVKYADGELERLGQPLMCNFLLSLDLEHKLFIGMLPKNVSEVEISALFSQYGTIKDLQVLRGSQQTSKGCAFLKYETKDQALAALEAINGKHKMEYFGPSSGIQPQNSVGEGREHLIMLKLDSLFIRQAQTGSKLRKGNSSYVPKSHASVCLICTVLIRGSSVPLVVKWADTEKERQARRAQKAQSQASNVPHSDSQHPSLFGALPMGYVPPYNGYGYQAPGGYGLMPYRMPPMQSQHGFHNMMPHMNHQGNALRPDLGPNMNPRNYHVAPASYVGSYPAVTGLQHPMAYPTGMISPRPMNASPGSVSPASGNNNTAASSGGSKNSGGQVEGPPGANLFIYHIPQEFGDEELANAFQPFGMVLSAKVFVDKATGVSKCFGFVSYDSPEDAQSAIGMMNGFQLGVSRRFPSAVLLGAALIHCFLFMIYMENPSGFPSNYMLLEASGDSETDCNPTMEEEHGCEIAREDDDAQSCIHDTSETSNAAELKGYEFWNNDHDADDVDDDEKKCEVHGTSYCDDDDDQMQEQQKFCVSDESGHEVLDEMEKNRRFWEACLAS
ncbi:hypothetical protein V8G54_021162 [Vigna mungo]|uniref:RRM domain-containing protein n=1 Tax=Vigna mungo TaxID=3915 RepID=A0AAQ3RXF5_VIGMU